MSASHWMIALRQAGDISYMHNQDERYDYD